MEQNELFEDAMPTNYIQPGWHKIRAELMAQGFSSNLLDMLYGKARIWAGHEKWIVFRRNSGGCQYFYQQTDGKFKTSSADMSCGCFSVGDGYCKKIAVVEYPLDAIAYHQLNRDTLVMATGCTVSLRYAMRSINNLADYDFAVAFMDDFARNNEHKEMLITHPNIRRIAPPKGKRWIDMLKNI